MQVKPAWAESHSDFAQEIAEAHRRSVNFPDGYQSGEGVRVGIIDSVAEPPQSVRRDFNVQRGELCLDSEPQNPSGHGSWVFNHFSSMAPGAEVQLYQAVNERDRIPTEAFDQAINAAIRDDIDILNISSGDPWPGPIDSNPNVRIVDKAIRNGITVVAAAGNHLPGQDKPPVHCPAAHDEVIAVGGFVAKCPADGEPEQDTDREIGPYYSFRDEDVSDFDVDPYPANITEGTYCRYLNCKTGSDCINNRTEVEWEYNPIPTGGKPDILAPVHFPFEGDQVEYLLSGSSFATPIVAGTLASVYSDLKKEGVSSPPPHLARSAVVTSGMQLNGRGTNKKLDALRLRETLLQDSGQQGG